MGKWLGIPHRDIGVEFCPPKGFLLLLPSPAIRDRALSSNAGVAVGRAKLQTRLAGAETAKLSFKVRLCVEGVPHHARQLSTLRQLLFPKDLCWKVSTSTLATTRRLVVVASSSGLRRAAVGGTPRQAADGLALRRSIHGGGSPATSGSHPLSRVPNNSAPASRVPHPMFYEAMLPPPTATPPPTAERPTQPAHPTTNLNHISSWSGTCLSVNRDTLFCWA